MRAIDRHEDAIVRVLDLTDNGMSYVSAIDTVCMDYALGELSAGRLDQLLSMWCALAGIDKPNG